MPYKAEIIYFGPQYIEAGLIKLNDEQVHEGFGHYEDGYFAGLVNSRGLLPTTDIYIEDLECTSSAVVSSLVDDLRRTIDEVQGLKSLTIEYLLDKNSLQKLPLSQLVLACPHLESLKFIELGDSPDNRRELLVFAA